MLGGGGGGEGGCKTLEEGNLSLQNRMLDCSKRETELGSKRGNEIKHAPCVSGEMKDSPALRVGFQLKAVWLGGHRAALGTALGASVRHLTLSTDSWMR